VLLVTVEPVDMTTAVLRISGDIDQDTVPDLDHAVDQCLDSGYTHLVIDCADLRSCDSSGVTALLRAHQAASAHDGTIKLTRAGTVLRSRFQLTGLDQVLTLHDDAAAPSPTLLVLPTTSDPSSIEAQTESLARLTAHDTLPGAADDALSTAAQNSAETGAEATAEVIGSREALAALARTHAARRETRRQALDAARRRAAGISQD